MLVKDIMQHDVACVRPETHLEEVVRLLQRRSVRHLPVLDHEDLVGRLAAQLDLHRRGPELRERLRHHAYRALTQRIGAQIAHGAVEDSRVCADKPDRIVITIPAVDTRFGGGPAFVQARLTSCILNPEIPCYSARDEAAVTLPEPTG